MKKSPIVALNGGLGNQLFQWFFAHTIDNGGSFRIDRLFKEHQSSNGVAGPELGQLFARCHHVYRDSQNMVVDAKFRKILHLANHMWAHPIFRSLLSVLGYYRENPNAEVAQSLSVPNPIRYAFGYFQNAELMEKAEKAIESELIPVVESHLGLLKVKFGLEKPYTVIHLRRYGTAGVKLTRIQFCNLSQKYFTEWAKANAGGKVVLLTEHKDQVAEVIEHLNPELVLDSSQTSAWDVVTIMAGAEKCLGSNSSLSWWGVSLCSKLGGQVWLPSNWSYWENVDPGAFHFKGCNIAAAEWDISGFE
jgi:hypothetical protein